MKGLQRETRPLRWSKNTECDRDISWSALLSGLSCCAKQILFVFKKRPWKTGTSGHHTIAKERLRVLGVCV